MSDPADEADFTVPRYHQRQRRRSDKHQVTTEAASHRKHNSAQLTQRRNEAECQATRTTTDIDPVGEKYSEPGKTRYNVHSDDIHTLLQVDERHFVSGSKDCTVKLWSTQGDPVQTMYEPPPHQSSYRSWVTCSMKTSGNHVICGFRDGRLQMWGDNFQTLASATHTAIADKFKSKDRNHDRVLCMVEDGKNILLGCPLGVCVWSLDALQSKSGGYMAVQRLTSNDWVYCIERISASHLALVLASNLEIYDASMSAITEKWRRQVIIIDNNRYHRDQRQRPHISAIQRVGDSYMACACFDGVLRLADLCTPRVVSQRRAHRGRMWAVTKVLAEEQCIATSADDACIRLWDCRTLPRAVCELQQRPHGRVSQLLALNPFELLAASCPDDPHNSETKGQFTFWDLRMTRSACS